MFVEEQKAGKKKKFYLAHSFRHEGKVKKIRVFLGSDLDTEELETAMLAAEKRILLKVQDFKKIQDPLLEVLSKDEIEKIRQLQEKKAFKVFHLSEEQWEIFSEIFAYNTNAIEGSRLSQNEVKQILEKGQWPKDKTREDISEAYGVRDAIKFIRETNDGLSIGLIKKIHWHVFRNSKPFAGNFRCLGNEVAVVDAFGNIVHRGAPSEKVLELLKELCTWYKKFEAKYPSILLASIAHNQFENIHPFEDGNGRVGRILMNYVLIKHGLPPVNIDFTKRSQYYAALKEYEDNHDIKPTIELLLEEFKALKKRLKTNR